MIARSNIARKRTEKLKTRKIDPSIDNMLKITVEGRKAADFEGNKVNLAVREIHDI